jgi:hypothetical protein
MMGSGSNQRFVLVLISMVSRTLSPALIVAVSGDLRGSP